MDFVKRLDSIADRLEGLGLAKLAASLDAVSNSMEKFYCNSCSKDLPNDPTDPRDWYMVNDEIWNQVAGSPNDKNLLCWDCLCSKVRDRTGRELDLSDFTDYEDAPINKNNPEVRKLLNSY
jgi:hypothetical protein